MRTDACARVAQAFLGLQRTEGLGVMSFEPTTLVTLGGCTPKQEARPHCQLTPCPPAEPHVFIGSASKVCSHQLQ